VPIVATGRSGGSGPSDEGGAAMTEVGYVAAGYVITALAVAGYAWRVVSKGRRTGPLVPQERRRWM